MSSTAGSGKLPSESERGFMKLDSRWPNGNLQPSVISLLLADLENFGPELILAGNLPILRRNEHCMEAYHGAFRTDSRCDFRAF